MSIGAIGEGVLSSYNMFQDMKQRRFNNDMARRQDARAQAQEGRLATEAGDKRDTKTANELYNTYQTFGFLSDDRMGLDKGKVEAAIQSDNEQTRFAARQFVKDAALTSGLLPEGTKDVEIVAGPNGGFALKTINADGSPGMVTVDGSSNPDSEVAQFPTLTSLVNNLNHTYMTKVLPMQDRFDPNVMRNTVDFSDAVLEEINVVGQLPAPVARGVIGGMASLDGQPEEQQVFVNQVKADTLGDQSVPEPAPEPEPDNSARVQELRDGIERLTNRKARLREGSPLGEKIDGEVDALRKELEGLQKPTAEFDNPKLEAKAVAVEEKTPEEIRASVDSGETALDDEEIVLIQQDLERAGVREVSDLQKLSRRKKAVAIAAILASEGDATVRAAKAKELSNVLETGTLSSSAKEQRTMDQNDQTLANQRDNVALRAGELKRGIKSDAYARRKGDNAREDSAANTTVTLMESTIGIFTGESGVESPNGYKAKAFVNTVLPSLRQRATSSKVPGEADKYNQAIDAGLSMVIAGLAAEEDGGFWETFASFSRDDVNDDFSTGDFSLSRVRMKTDKDGRPEMFFYTDAQGAPLDEGVKASALQKLDSNAYNLIVQRVRRNQAKQKSAGG